MSVNIHEKYINRAIELAKNSLGVALPNPSVGAVIVHDHKIIGEGYTSAYGGSHAEVNAIASVRDKTLLKNAAIYVTLEPCAHYGKTPPCTDLIIHHRIPAVYVGCVDTHSKVSGKGIEKLESAGCKVRVGILEKACQAHHKRFLTYHNKKRPYIILKWAVSSDGLMAPKEKTSRRPVWITSPYSRQLVHKWRHEEQAILVGTETVIADNPSLNTRYWAGRNPTRIVLGTRELAHKTHTIFDTSAKTIQLGANRIDFREPLAVQIAKQLYDQHIVSVIIEGGRRTLQNFIDANLWDEARVFTGPSALGQGLKAPHISGHSMAKEIIGDDILNYYKND